MFSKMLQNHFWGGFCIDFWLFFCTIFDNVDDGCASENISFCYYLQYFEHLDHLRKLYFFICFVCCVVCTVLETYFTSVFSLLVHFLWFFGPFGILCRHYRLTFSMTFSKAHPKGVSQDLKRPQMSQESTQELPGSPQELPRAPKNRCQNPGCP